MKKTIITLALASFGAVAFAQNEPMATPASNFIIGAKIAFESEFISYGQEHSDENIQTTISAEYLIPSGGDFASSIYGNLFYMSPLTQSYNQATLTLGAKAVWLEEYFVDFGYIYTGFPNGGDGKRAARAIEMNDAMVNRENALYFGIGRDIDLIEGEEWSRVLISAYANWNWNCDQMSYELALAKVFDNVAIDELSIVAKVAYGYVDADKWAGDQGAPAIKNAYGYFASSVDAVYAISDGMKLNLGVRYAYNNDGNVGTNTDQNLWWGFGLTCSY